MENICTIIEVQHKTCRHLKRLLDSFEKKSTQSKTRGYVLSLLEEVEQTYRNFKQDHEHICEMALENSIAENDVPYLKDDFYYEFFDLYLTFKTKLLDLSTEHTTSQNQMTSTFVSSNTENTSFASSARLPKMEIPTFNGDYIEWIPYRDMFLTLVHQNQSLTGIQKYFYLKGSCKGSPLEIVNQYPASDDNYEAAWRALEERYHNTRKITDQIFKRFVSLPQLDGSFKGIKDLVDSTRSTLSQLKSLNVVVGDAMLIFLISQKLDKQTKKEWEQSINSSVTTPSMTVMLNFLEMSFRTLESFEESTTSLIREKPTFVAKRPQTNKSYRRPLHSNTASVDTIYCPCCQRRHPLYKCFKFSSLPPADKKKIISQHNVCPNCLHTGHTASQYKSSARCQECKKNHHTILHAAYFSENQNKPQINKLQFSAAENVNQQSLQNFTPHDHYSANLSSVGVNRYSQVLLATATVLINYKNGKHTVKALVDPGSQASFVTTEVCKLLELSKQKLKDTAVSGIGASHKTLIHYYVSLQLRSAYQPDFCLELDALVINKLTSYKPSNINKNDLPNLQQYCLSDQTFYLPSKIDILLGSDVYGDILLESAYKFPNSVYLQESRFGWLVSGPTGKSSTDQQVNVTNCNLENQLRLFWEQEELTEEKKWSQEEELCEALFIKTYKRNIDGRFTCAKRFKRLESTFKFRPQFATAYKEFIAEYIALNHMEKIGNYPQDLPTNCFLLPHHGVLRESNATTKLRVVFDGSNKSTSQKSLNEELSPGPALQNDLPEIVTR